MISSPLVDAVSVAMFLGMFGWKTTIIYVVSGIILSMIAGFILGKMKLEHLLTDWVQQLLKNKQLSDDTQEDEQLSLLQRIPIILKKHLELLRGYPSIY